MMVPDRRSEVDC